MLEELESRAYFSASPISLHVAGDLNHDGHLSGGDAIIMNQYLSGEKKITPAIIHKSDCTGDGKLTSADFTRGLQLWFPPLPVMPL